LDRRRCHLDFEKRLVDISLKLKFNGHYILKYFVVFLTAQRKYSHALLVFESTDPQSTQVWTNI